MNIVVFHDNNNPSNVVNFKLFNILLFKVFLFMFLFLSKDKDELRELVDRMKVERDKMKEEQENLNQEVTRLKEVENILGQLR